MRAKKRIGAALLCALLGLCCGCGGEDPAPTAETVTLPPITGEYETDAEGRLVIELGGNPTTGYTWSWGGGDDVLIRVSQGYVPESTDPTLCGGGGTYYFVFAPLRDGQATLTFYYGRSWENTFLRRIRYEITVTEGIVCVTERVEDTPLGR